MPTQPPNPNPPPPESASDRALRHGAMLRELGEIGMRVARAMGERATAAAEDAAVPQGEAESATLGYARAARCLQQTLALEARLAEGLPPPRWPVAQGRRAGARARTLAGDRLDDEPDDEDLAEEREWLGDPDADALAAVGPQAGFEALSAAVRQQAAEVRAALGMVPGRARGPP